MIDAENQASQEYVDRKVAAASAGKVDKESGKGLSSNDYTSAEKAKLAAVEPGAQRNVPVTWGDVGGKPSTFAPSAHNHQIEDVEGLGVALAGKQQQLTTAQQAVVNAGVDTSISAGSTKLARSGDVHAAVQDLQSAVDDALDERQPLLNEDQVRAVNSGITAELVEKIGHGGTTDYGQLQNKPKINGVELKGNIPLVNLGITPYGIGALSISGGTVNGNVYLYGQDSSTELQVGPGGYGGTISVYSGQLAEASIKKDGVECATVDDIAWWAKAGQPKPGDVTKAYVDAADSALGSRIDLIEATTKPNMNIVGSPRFNQGVVSGFSANDYLMFPTQVNVGQNTVEFYMSFTTGSDVTTQQNLLDSWCGLAFAIADGGTVTAVSTDGTSFAVDQSFGTISANSSYRLKLRFEYNDIGTYDTYTYLADGAGEYEMVGGILQTTAPLFPTATYWGGANPASGVHHVFGGTINLNECRMVWNGTEVWRGYDELPTVKYDPTAEPVLDTAEKIVGVVKDAVSLNNRFLVDATTAAIQTRADESEEFADEIRLDKGYDALTGDTVVKLDKSVQTVTVGGSNLEIVLPDAVTGTVRDFCVYANNSGDADTALTFPPGTYYGDDPNGAVAKAGKVTGIYLSEIPNGVWTLGIRELEQHEVTA